jgi:hypothetical protein
MCASASASANADDDTQCYSLLPDGAFAWQVCVCDADSIVVGGAANTHKNAIRLFNDVRSVSVAASDTFGNPMLVGCGESSLDVAEVRVLVLV